jgi:ABC-type Zn uptake system ZnuABC Zn-binding protein ZnuA
LPRFHQFVLFVALLFGTASWASPAPAQAQERPLVVTTVAPLTNIAQNVGGNRIRLAQIVPDGSDSHTFEPTPADAMTLGQADLIVINGLNLETSTLDLAEANKKESGRILLLGDNTITRDQWVFDFSFPEDQGDPNPHLWMNPLYALRYAELIRDELKQIDPANASYYDQNTARFAARIAELDQAIASTIQTIPPENRKLLTYHDSFAYFAPRYGLTVIGAVQPSDFAEPSPREVAALIDQLKAEQVPAIFGSEVFPSRVLDQLAREAGIVFVETLRDDDLPGAQDDPEHTYVGMLVEDVTTMTGALGGTTAAIEAVDPQNTYLP